jgi:hypothetical protein
VTGEYGIIANVLEPDKIFRTGAKVWIAGGTGGEGWTRFEFFGMSRGGRNIRKWAPTVRFHQFRSAWIPDHMRDTVYYFTGSSEEMEAIAAQMNDFADSERAAHPNRRAAL